MRYTVDTIRNIVRDEIARGTVIDVENYCTLLQPKYPELTHKQIQELLLEVVCKHGGGARWGT